MNLKSKWKKLAVTAMALGIVIGAMGCGSSNNAATDSKPAAVKGNITGSGSSALLPLVKDAAEAFKKKNPDVSISLNAGGSGMGLKQVSEGSVDMGNSDVPANTKLTKEQADKLEDHKICVMTVATIVNKDIAATVKSLTNQQLADIFTAKVTNWKEVGGPDMRIVVYSRETSSGTYEFFKESVLKNKNYMSSSLSMPATGAIIQSVSQTKGAIGYVGLAYVSPRIKTLSISYDGEHYATPTVENATNKTYPIVRPLYYYYDAKNKTQIAPLLEFILSPEGQDIIKKSGYIPVK